MNRSRRLYIPLALLGTLCFGSAQVFGQSSDNQPQTTAERISHFSETLSVPTRSGIVKKLDVEIDDWDLPLGESEFEAPADASVIIHVREGSLSARVEGVSTTHKTGDYWTIPKGTHVTFSLSSAHDSALIRTIIAAPIPGNSHGEGRKSAAPAAR